MPDSSGRSFFCITHHKITDEFRLHAGKKDARRNKARCAARHREAYFPQENVPDCDRKRRVVNTKSVKLSAYIQCRYGDDLTRNRCENEKGSEDRPPFANYGWIEFSYFTTVWNNGDCSSAE